MRKEDKNQLIDSLTEQLKESNTIYLADISSLNSVDTFKLRKLCFDRRVKLRVVKNTLLKKAMEKSEKDMKSLFEILEGPTSLMLSETGNAPARLIKEFRKNSEKPVLKGAYVEEMVFIGDDKLDMLSELKSKNEMIADIIALLQSPARNIISALQSGGSKLSGILTTLSER